MVISLLQFIRDGESHSEHEAHYRLGLAMQGAFHVGCAIGCRRSEENLQLENCIYDTETGEMSFSLCNPDGDSDSDDAQTGDIIH